MKRIYILIATFLCSLSFAISQTPTNDSCESAQIIIPSTTVQYDTFRISGATSDTTGCRTDNDVWFKFEMPTSGGIRIRGQRVQLNHDLAFRLYTGVCGSITTYACTGTCQYYSTGNCGTELLVKDTSLYGDTVYLRASKYYSFTTGDTAAISVEHILDQEFPNYNDCENARLVSPSLTLTYDTLSLANSLTELSSTYCYDDEDIWVKFEVPSSGAFEVISDDYNMSHKVGFRLYENNCSSLTPLTCDGTCQYTNTTSNCQQYLRKIDPNIAGDTVLIRISPRYDFSNRDSFGFGILEIPSSEILTNDTCNGAIDISYTTTSGKDTFNLKNAMTELTTGYCYDDEDIWFKFEIPSSGGFEILQDRYNMTHDIGTRLYEYNCASLTPLTCNGTCQYLNTTSNCQQYLRMVDTSLIGDTVLMRVSPRYDFSNRDSFLIEIKEIPASEIVPNDICDNAILITPKALMDQDSFSLKHSLQETSTSCHDEEDVWFKFQAPSNGAFNIKTEQVYLNHQASMQLFTGSCASKTAYSCDSNCNFYSAGNTCSANIIVRDTSIGNDTIWVRVSARYSFTIKDTFSIGIQYLPDSVLPQNDDCQAAQLMSVTQGSCILDTFNNKYTTYSSVPTGTCGQYNGADVWFKFEMPSSDDVFIDMEQVTTTSKGYRITAFSGGCGALVEEDCSNSTNYPDLSIRNLGLAGDTVYLHVYRENTTTDGDTFGLCVIDTVLPPLRVQTGDYEKTTSCNILSGNGWFDLTDDDTLLVMSINPGGNYLGRTCFGVHIEDSASTLRTANDTFGNTAYLGPRHFFIDPFYDTRSATIQLYFNERELEIWRDSLSARGIAVGPDLETFYQDSMRISKMDGGDLTYYLGGNPVQINPTVTLIRDSIVMAEFSVTSFSNFVPIFNPGNAPTPVPVDWLSFDGDRNPENVRLTWITASELNCSHYEIQKSTDGISFRTIGIVDGNGTTNTNSHYTFSDHQPGFLKAYYRLKQIDFNGSFDFSKTLVFDLKTEVVISPNPFQNELVINNGNNPINTIQILDLFGKVVFANEINATSVAVDLKDVLSSGIYILRIEDESGISEQRIIKY